MIQVYKTVSADNSDVLAGTDLDPIPSDASVAVVYIASTQTDTACSIQTPQMPVARNIQVQQTTSGAPDLGATAGELVPVVGGSKLSISIDITTAATVGILVQVQ